MIINTTRFQVLSSYRSLDESIEPAADALLQRYGRAAPSEASRQICEFNSNGLHPLAGIWQKIRHRVIEKSGPNRLR